MRQRLERYFDFQRLGTAWRTEILAGITTFVTMAYVVFLNPSILAEAGMPFQAVVAATCFSAALGSLLMGAFARYPIALAPGMGLNAYFTYTVVKGMHVPWETALGAVFLSGLAFLILTLAGAARLIAEAIPPELYAAVASGIGLFIAMIGLRNAGIIVASPSTLVTLGNLRDKNTLLAMFGLVSWSPQAYHLADIGATAGKLDIAAAAKLGLLEVVFVFLFVDVFDNLGTLMAVSKKAGLLDEEQHIPRLRRILLADASATLAGSLAGTSTVVSYIESAAGVAAGGRSGVTAIVTGALFIAAIFIAPLVGTIPDAATAPALIVVGSLMMTVVREIDWEDAEVAIPAFLTMLAIPLTFSIANGLAFGFIAFTVLKIARGKFREVNWLVYVLTLLFVARFAYLAQG